MPTIPTVVFICEHGAAKSVIAATYLAALAKEASIEVRALARGTDPEPALSPVAIAGLTADGVDLPDHGPQRPTAGELASATTVVSFGPALNDLLPEHTPREYWSDVPAVSDGYPQARDAIVVNLRVLLARLSSPE